MVFDVAPCLRDLDGLFLAHLSGAIYRSLDPRSACGPIVVSSQSIISVATWSTLSRAQ